MMKVLEDKLNFAADVSVPNSYEAAEYQVCDNYIFVIICNAMELH